MKTNRTRKSRYSSDKDGYYQRKYGRSESEVKEVLTSQAGQCRTCGATGKTRSIPLDHDHKVEGWKIDSKRTAEGWSAWPRNYPDVIIPKRLHFTETARTKSEAIKRVKAKLKRLSSRGLICWQCNSALKKLRDDHHIAHALGYYLEKYQSFLNGELDNANGFGA